MRWSEWTTVRDGKSTPRGCVTAVPWGNEGRFALFLADPNGGVFTTGGWTQPAQNWGYWATVSQGGTMPGAQVTAVPFGQRFALFIVNPAGAVFTTGGTPDAPFGPWAHIPELQTTQYAFVTAVPWEGRFALFVADDSGWVRTIVGDPQQGFEGPWDRVADGQTLPGAQVAAVVPSTGAPVTLFISDRGGGCSPSRDTLNKVGGDGAR